MFAEKHGERIWHQLGLEPQEDWKPDLTSVKAGFGLDDTTERVTHREIQARRAQVREKFEEEGNRTPGATGTDPYRLNGGPPGRRALRSGRALVHAPRRSAVTEKIEEGTGGSASGPRTPTPDQLPAAMSSRARTGLMAVCQTTA